MNPVPFWAEQLNQTLQNRKWLATGEVAIHKRNTKPQVLKY
jgi:hypothetical protein